MKKYIVSLVLIMSSALAQANGGYLGISYSKLDSDVTNGGVSFESEPEALKVTGGGFINENVALEASLAFGIKDDDVGPFEAEFELKNMFSLYGLAVYPANEKLSVYAKFGFAGLSFEDIDSEEASGTGLSYGFGTEFKFTETVGLALEYIVYPDAEFDNFSNVEVETKSIDFRLNFHF